MVAENQEISLNETSSATQSENGVGHSKPKSNVVFGLFILLIILSLAGAGYFFLNQLRTKQEGLDGELDKEDRRLIQVTDQLTNFQTQIATLQSQISSMETKISTQDGQFERLISEHSDRHTENLGRTKNSIDQDIQRINRQLGKTRGDWMVADAEYLLSIANERLHLVGDVKTSILALEAADQRLRESGDPSVFKIRDALAKEINILKNVKPPDIVGLSSKLRALEGKTPKIPLFLPHHGKIEEHTSAQSDQEKQPDADDWNEVFDMAFEDIKGLVTVKRTDRPIEAVLLQEEAALFREELRLKLEMARLSLIQRDEDLFRIHLDDALHWLATHFDTDADETKRFISEIKTIRDVSIDIDFPDISNSLVLLRNIAKLRIESDKALQYKSSNPGL